MDKVLADGVLDAGIVAELAGMGDLLPRVAGMFLRQAPLNVAKLNAHAASGDTAMLADDAHALASMCGSIGATAARIAALALEASARATGGAGGHLQTVKIEVAAAMAAAAKLSGAS